MKPYALSAWIIAAALSLGACSDSQTPVASIDTSTTASSAPASTASLSGDVKTVTDMKGEVTIPVSPQRIVDVSGSADELIILGQTFVGSANTSMFDGVTVPDYLQDYFQTHEVETVGNYSGSVGDLNLEKIAALQPDLIIMNIRHDKVYDQLKAIAPTVMIDDDINYVNWRGRFEQLGEWFGQAEVVSAWLADYDQQAEELSAKVKTVIGDETVAVVEANSVHFGSYYVYRSGGPGELIYDDLKLSPSAGVPSDVWGEVVDAEYFSQIDADHLFFFSDDGQIGDTADSPAWQNLEAVQKGNVYLGVNSLQYDMAYTPNGKLLYMQKLAQALIDHSNVQ
ncbi:ABC transporter substrate-binding protein [Oscillospiraceae bacterium HV4-5-C5C]|nr:ABC transporter substrate-binding protein [Oscillospiraceae bacterium HV4-5-C5C]